MGDVLGNTTHRGNLRCSYVTQYPFHKHHFMEQPIH